MLIAAYARAVRRISERFDCCPDKLTLEQLEQYFSDLVKSHSWTGVSGLNVKNSCKAILFSGLCSYQL
jgi:hypothetical protein